MKFTIWMLLPFVLAACGAPKGSPDVAGSSVPVMGSLSCHTVSGELRCLGTDSTNRNGIPAQCDANNNVGGAGMVYIFLGESTPVFADMYPCELAKDCNYVVHESTGPNDQFFEEYVCFNP